MSKLPSRQTSADPSRHARGIEATPDIPWLPDLPMLAEVREGDREEWFRLLGYTFWNRELLDRLAERIRAEGPAAWVELAAGTGRLTAELTRRGVDIVATDNYSQRPEVSTGARRSIDYGSWVHCLPAREAMSLLRPEAVLCAWPPLGSYLVPDLTHGAMEGSESLRTILCIGEPGGATEAPVHPHEVPDGWTLDEWPECDAALYGFHDPPGAARSNSRLLVYRKVRD